MATQLHRVLENTRWRIEGISPTVTDICLRGFQRLDKSKASERESSALERNFYVDWLSRGADLYVTDRSEVNAVHKVAVSVIYWPGRGWDEAQELIAQDQFDIAQALRRDDYYLGYSDAATSDDLLIKSRVVDEMTLDTSEDDAWILRLVLSVQLTERA